ncbi:MAG: c-type cytochrome biogenesis protein CcmI [Pseudomonadota bacterium]
MSIVFITFALVLAAVFAAALIFPMRGAASGADRERAAADALAARLGDIDRARAAGLLEDAAADEATLAAQRAAIQSADASAPRNESRAIRLAAVAFAGLAPILVGITYFQIGAPNYESALVAEPAPASPAADIAALPPEERAAAIEGMVDGLAARLEAEPNNPDGWRMLARSQAALGRLDASLDSQRRLLSLVKGDLQDWKDFAATVARVRSEERFPTDEEFLGALNEIEARSAGDPFVRFYRGGAALETGDPAAAAEIWRGLLAEMPADAPVRPVLETLIDDAEAAQEDSG